MSLGPADSSVASNVIVDAHVHFWDPRAFHYPWLDGVASLNRPFALADYASAAAHVPIEKLVVVECNCAPDESVREAQYFECLATAEPRIAGIVAFADLTQPRKLDASLEALAGCAKVKGIRHNIQGEPPGFCLQPYFVAGVRKSGRRGLTFDLCATHDQLADVLALVRDCPETRLVLDHCGKPGIRDGHVEPWSTNIARLAEHANVWCKLSGLLTEAAEGWREQDLAPYAKRVLDSFGTERLIYGSDWPVLTLAGQYTDWYDFTTHFSARWSDAERRRFYYENAAAV